MTICESPEPSFLLQVVTLCGFLVEVVLVEAWPLETRPSLLAAAALHAALSIIHGALAAHAVSILMPAYFRLLSGPSFIQ